MSNRPPLSVLLLLLLTSGIGAAAEPELVTLQPNQAHQLHAAHTISQASVSEIENLFISAPSTGSGFIGESRSTGAVSLGQSPYDLLASEHEIIWFYLSIIGTLGIALLIGGLSLHIQRINRKLRESERLHRQLIDTTPFPVIITTLGDNKIVYINRYAETNFGIRQEEVIGQRADNFWADSTRRTKMMEQLIAKRHIHDFEAELVTKHGRHFWGYISASVTLYNGMPSLLISFNDITERKRMEEALRASEQRYRMLAENAFDVIWTFDIASRRFTYVSPSVQRLRGYTVDEVMQQTLDDALTPDSARQAKDGLKYLIETGDILERKWELEQPCKNGSTVWTDVALTLIRDRNGKPIEVMGIARDITEQHQLREALKTRLVAIDAAAEAIVITDKNGIIEYVNPAFCQMTGYSLEEAVGRNPNITKSGLHPQEFYQELWEAILAGKIWRGEITNRNRIGELYTESVTIAPVMDDNGEITHFVASKYDITERKQMESRLEHMAHFDMLTGVPNRQLFFERLEQSLTLARRHEEQLALLFIDLDGFKEINDTHGHEAGDIVLRTIAQRLHEAIRESDTVARVGGDEFVILINTLHEMDSLEAILHKLLDAITQPIMVQGITHTIGASIGVSLYPEHGYDAATLLSHADSAMYVSKRSGKNRWTLYQAH